MGRFYHILLQSVLFSLSALFTLPAIAQCPITVSAGEDIYLCNPPTPTQLQGSIDGDYLNFTWTPTQGLTGIQTLSPTVNVTQTTNYVLTVKAVNTEINLINNGDFESGNSNFSSNYTYSPGNLWPEGVYDVLADPSTAHSNFAACNDHTSGGGQMMAVNGNAAPNQNVWCQTVSIQPNTEYAFTAWGTSLVGAAPAILQFSVNGTNLGTPFALSPALCTWQKFYAIWNSGANVSANICVVNQNTAVSGNDFALDDISFSPVCVVRDTVTAHVINLAAVASPSTQLIPCEGAQITLNGTGSSTGPNITYEWDSPNGNIVSGANTLMPVVDAAGTYVLTVTFNNGQIECTKTATVTVTQSAPLLAWITPPQPLGCGGSSVNLTANSSQGNASYAWNTLNGNIVSGANQKICSVNQPGEYTVTVTNTATGCTSTAEVTVFEATDPPNAVATAVDTLSCLQPTTVLSGLGSSVGPGITYLWSTVSGGNIASGQNSLNATVNGPGVYALAVTNTANSCVTIDTVSVFSNINLPILDIPTPDTFDCATSLVNLSSSLQPAGFTYQWSTTGGQIISPTNAAQVQTSAPGMYSLTVTNPSNGCSSQDSVLVLANFMAPTAVALSPDSITCVQNSVLLSGAGSSTGPLFSYQWSGPGLVSGENTLNPVVNSAGSYTLVVLNQQNACRDTATTTVFSDANAITAVANAPDTLDCATFQIVLNSNGSSSGPGFTYEWTTNNGIIAGGANSPNPTVLSTGTYHLLLTNPANGCTSTDQAVVLQDTLHPTLSIAFPDTLTCSDPIIQLQATTGNGASLQLLWSTHSGNIVAGHTTSSPSVSAPGFYTLQVLNPSNGCSALDSVMVQQEAGLPVVVITPPEVINCQSPSIVLNATNSSSGMSINWSASNGGQYQSGTNTLSPIVQSAGNYQLTLTNLSNGCTATGEVTVVADQVPPPAIGGPNVTLTCLDPMQVLTVNADSVGNFLYQWQTQGGVLPPVTSEPSIAVTSAGTYIAQVLNPVNGCSASDTIQVVSDQQAPPVSAVLPPVLNCINTTLQLQLDNTASNFTYNWDTMNGLLLQGANSSSPSVGAPGNYLCIITNPGNGCVTVLSVPVDEDLTAPSLQLAPTTLLTCTNLVVPINANTNTALLDWSTTNGQFAVDPGTATTALVNAPGTYQVIATDNNTGCTTVQSILVQQDIVAPSVNAGNPDTLDCQITSLNLSGTASAGAQLIWTGPAGINIGGATTLSPTISAPGTYQLIATNPSNGCSSSDDVEISEDSNAPSASIQTPGVLTCTNNQLNLQGQGTANSPVTYLWQASNGGAIIGASNQPSILISQPGTYQLLVTSTENGCTATASVPVQQNTTPPSLQAPAGAQLTCSQPTPSLTAQVASGTLVTWTTQTGLILSGANSPQIVTGAGGSYTITATNPVNGCQSSAFSIVSVDTLAPAIAILPPSTLTCTQTQLNLVGQVQQPSANFTSSWSTIGGQLVSGTQGLNPTVNQPGTYTLFVTNQQNGCSNSTSTQVLQNTTPPLATAVPNATITCVETSPALNGTGSSPGTYLWTGPQINSGANSLQPLVGAPGNYQLQVTDPSNGCTATTTVMVALDQLAPLLSITTAPTLTCTNLLSPLSASVLNLPPGTFSPVWSTTNGQIVSGNTTLEPAVALPGNYQLQVTNLSNGCTSTASTLVLQDITAPPADAGPNALLHCNQLNPILTGNSLPGMAYQWTGGPISAGQNSSIATVDAAGVYTLFVTNPANGCTSSDVAEVIEVAPPEFDLDIVQPDCRNTQGLVEIVPIPSGNLSSTQYSFDGGLSYSSLTQKALLPGEYTLVIRDAFGCTSEENVLIEEPFIPSVTLPAVYRIEQGESIQLLPQTDPAPSEIAIWSWTPGTHIDCEDCERPLVSPLKTTEYFLTITDQNGCTANARTRVEVDERRYVYAPNIFTPESADNNNRFLVFTRGALEIQLLQIFDRWGNLVWQGEHLSPNNPAQGWDGNLGGVAVNPGVFVWKANILFPDGRLEVYAGDVTVAR